MLKQLKFAILAVALVSFLASCSNESSSNDQSAENVDNAALSSVTPNDTVDQSALGEQAGQPADANAPTGPTTTIEFAETEFDFGVIEQGEKVTHVYKFKNTGNEPLIISSAKGSCGCTVPQWPKEPVAPGAEGEIKVEFDSKGKRSKQNKKVTIVANTNPSQSFIYLKGDVNAPEQPATGTPAQ